ncbi:5'-nucleotidase domain-containing protein 1 isoform X3 [Eublepharis macularius]|uniref:5'-nucleotidase domain-containing protein 1 isoform X3 n=1 Tax=Eublepharis macularius TaxID=481883 RepID=A0AA97JCM9_EUBMA|nr:5'-nucleotidase domain-containing protein 1 isoform X3 [Eublepharis macularius]
MAGSFSLADCEVFAFDLDHTLCRYHLVESSRLIYDSFAQYLITEKGYDKELLNVPSESWDFCCKGIILDMEDGNFLKLACDGTVLRASHGTKHMTSEEILEKYGRREWRYFKTMSGMVSRSAKYYVYDNYFDLPGALLCARIVDTLNQHNANQKYDFWKDIVAAIQHNYKTSAFKENDDEQEALLSLDKPGWYSQGNISHLNELLKKMTDKLEPKVVYFGDSMHSDIFSAHHYSNWETVLILEELRGDPIMTPSEAEAEPLEKKGKYEGYHPKSLHAISKQWGSFFVDTISSAEDAAGTILKTWSCNCVNAYSTIAIPSIESIADLPLDYKFPRFSSKNSVTAGYFPKPPRSLAILQPMDTK